MSGDSEITRKAAAVVRAWLKAWGGLALLMPSVYALVNDQRAIAIGLAAVGLAPRRLGHPGPVARGDELARRRHLAAAYAAARVGQALPPAALRAEEERLKEAEFRDVPPE